MSPIVVGLLGLFGVGTIVALLKTVGAPKAAADAIQKAPDIETVTNKSSNKGIQAGGIVLHYLELALKKELNQTELTAALDFAGSHPSPAQSIAWAEENLGRNVVSDIEASLPDMAHDELALFGDHVPTVVRDLIARFLPGAIIAHAQTVVDAQTLKAQLVPSDVPSAAAKAAMTTEAQASQNAGTAATALNT